MSRVALIDRGQSKAIAPTQRKQLFILSWTLGVDFGSPFFQHYSWNKTKLDLTSIL